MTVNKRYFFDLMKDRKLSMREVARRMDAWPAGLSRALDGKRKLTLGDAAGLSRVLGVPLAEVMVNAGIDEAVQAGRRCNIIGHVREGGVVEPLSPGSIERVSIPDMLDDDTLAIQAHTADTPWSYIDGWLFFLGVQRDASELIGMYSLSELEGGERILGTIRRGYASGQYSIANANGTVKKNVRILSARRALITQH